MRSFGRAGLLTAVAIATVVLLTLTLVIGVSITDQPSPGAAPSVDPTKIPALASHLLPLITAITGQDCPELPPLWVIAHVAAESGWNPAAFSRDANGGAAGLYQINQHNWTTAGGRPWPSTPPPATADILQPDTHLQVGIPWVCANLRSMTEHLAGTGKPTPPLDAMLVCHIAGCARVTASATGVPRAGEAGCDTNCAQQISHYLDNVHHNLATYATPGGAGLDGLPTRAAQAGPAIRCTQPDPTSSGCLTAAARHALPAIQLAFGALKSGPIIRSTSCWANRPTTQRSDHPLGKACDLFPGQPGHFATGAELANGWRIAGWLRTHASALHVHYLIWQGRYWDPTSTDHNGWGVPYTGGGIHNPHDPTGGHYDHVHVSFAD